MLNKIGFWALVISGALFIINGALSLITSPEPFNLVEVVLGAFMIFAGTKAMKRNKK